MNSLLEFEKKIQKEWMEVTDRNGLDIWLEKLKETIDEIKEEMRQSNEGNYRRRFDDKYEESRKKILSVKKFNRKENSIELNLSDINVVQIEEEI